MIKKRGSYSAIIATFVLIVSLAGWPAPAVAATPNPALSYFLEADNVNLTSVKIRADVELEADVVGLSSLPQPFTYRFGVTCIGWTHYNGPDRQAVTLPYNPSRPIPIEISDTVTVPWDCAASPGAAVDGYFWVKTGSAPDQWNGAGMLNFKVELPKLTTTRSQIEKKYDAHAADFGISLPRGSAGFIAWEKRLRAFMGEPETLRVTGTYLGDPAILNYQIGTQLVVIQGLDGAFVSGWRMSDDQILHVRTRRSLGGHAPAMAEER